jgi:ADP-ribose pyrophosphatase YjhB (NUDIX family)
MLYLTAVIRQKGADGMYDVPTVYADPGFHIESRRVPDDVFAVAMTSFVIACVDVVLIDRPRRKMYLAKRCIEPACGLWWVLGGRRYAGESIYDAAIRHLKADADLSVDPGDLHYVCQNEYRWARREQEPKEIGIHVIADIVALHVSVEELSHAAAHLRPDEYDTQSGFREFNFLRLMEENAHTAMGDLHARIFDR